MSELDEQQAAVEETATAGPGRHLREARESRNLTIEQVATQLRMQVKIIEALEHDDYSDLPGTTFIQGYLRSYSRLLGLSEESVLSLMQVEGKDSELVSSISDGSVEVTSRDLPFRLVTVLVLLAALGGLGWWLSERTPMMDQEAEPVIQPDGPVGLTLPEVSNVAEETDELGGDEVASTSDSDESELPEMVEENDSASASAETLPSEEVATQEQEFMQEESTETPAEQKETSIRALNPPMLTPSIPQSVLELEYQTESWTEVTDAVGRKLAYGLIPAGKELTLRGEAPFKIFLGFASGVVVRYNGDVYNHIPFQRGDVARFRIGRAEHNRPVSGN